ncbi:hypothetical protein RHIZ_19215 [Rhizobium skierniewicense]|nr:hypothetical protein [Rhizobium skierniewicense]
MLHTTTGTFSGKASTVRNHSFTIAATDTALATYIATYTLAVPAGKPGTPVIGTATTGDGEADVAFTAPASNGGSAITSYTVTSIWRPIANSVSATVDAGSSANPIVCGLDQEVVKRNLL